LAYYDKWNKNGNNLFAQHELFFITPVGNYAYVADWDNGLVIVNVTNPAAPTLEGSSDTVNKSLGVTVMGNFAYVADYFNGLVILNISNPTLPTLKGSYDTDGRSFKVAVVGNYAYVADYTNGLEIFKIDATTPIPANMEVNPKTLNKASKGDKVTVYIEIPGYDIHNINVNTVKLSTNKGEVSALSSPVEVGDHNSNGIPDLMVKFDRQAVIGIVDVGDVVVTISGKISGEDFEGSDIIHIIDKKKG
jgi:hypothetical protein